MTDINALMLDMGRRARTAADALRAATPDARTEALTRLAEGLRVAQAEILAANARDVAAARAGGMSEALIDRLSLSPARIAGSGLNPDVFENSLSQKAPIRYTIQSHPPGQTQIIGAGIFFELPSQFYNYFFRHHLDGRCQIHIALGRYALWISGRPPE